MDLIRSRKSGGRKRSLFQRKPRWGLGDKGEVLAGECMASFVSHCLSLLWDCQYQCPHMSSINFCNFYFIQFSYGLCGPCTSPQMWAPFVSNSFECFSNCLYFFFWESPLSLSLMLITFYCGGQISVFKVVQSSRVAKCHRYGRYICVKILESWG